MNQTNEQEIFYLAATYAPEDKDHLYPRIDFKLPNGQDGVLYFPDGSELLPTIKRDGRAIVAATSNGQQYSVQNVSTFDS